MKYFGCGFEVGFLRFPDCTPPGRAGSRSPPRAREQTAPARSPPTCVLTSSCPTGTARFSFHQVIHFTK